jgi:hypothetical protein
MALWRFLDYVTEDGRNLIQEWYAEQDAAVQAQFDATLFMLGAFDDWEDPSLLEFRPLSRKHIGLGEVRFHLSTTTAGAKRPHRRRFRPVGIWPVLAEREFILLLGCEKTRMTYKPHGAFDVAAALRAALVDQGKGTTCEHI